MVYFLTVDFGKRASAPGADLVAFISFSVGGGIIKKAMMSIVVVRRRRDEEELLLIYFSIINHCKNRE